MVTTVTADQSQALRLVDQVAKAAHDQTLRLPECQSCHELMWPPEDFCDKCGGLTLELSQPLPLEGTLWSMAEYHHDYRLEAGPPVPYVVGMVTLAPGPAMIGRIEAAWEQLRVGLPVRAVFRVVRSDVGVVSFQPTATAGAADGPASGGDS